DSPGRCRPGERILSRSFFGQCLYASLGQAKIENLDLSRGRHKDIGRFDVAMNDAFLVSGIQSLGDLNADVEQLREQNPARSAAGRVATSRDQFPQSLA